ncbi:hypothetical protein IQ07DRAFT_635045 [Pyrenochaeta sp. DS3sAY3a]|nr:hypothetical protein IQ07DRAFT_635045 [Pyrenochaeta sp. DS3sAY3a]
MYVCTGPSSRQRAPNAPRFEKRSTHFPLSEGARSQPTTQESKWPLAQKRRSAFGTRNRECSDGPHTSPFQSPSPKTQPVNETESDNFLAKTTTSTCQECARRRAVSGDDASFVGWG